MEERSKEIQQYKETLEKTLHCLALYGVGLKVDSGGSITLVDKVSNTEWGINTIANVNNTAVVDWAEILRT